MPADTPKELYNDMIARIREEIHEMEAELEAEIDDLRASRGRRIQERQRDIERMDAVSCPLCRDALQVHIGAVHIMRITVGGKFFAYDQQWAHSQGYTLKCPSCGHQPDMQELPAWIRAELTETLDAAQKAHEMA